MSPRRAVHDTTHHLGGPVSILCATALMSLQDAIVKVSSADMPLWQLFFLRSVIVLSLLPLMPTGGAFRRLLAVLDPWVALRSVLIAAMYVFFYAALPVLDLTTVSAVYYTGPLFIVLFSAILLRERVGPSRIMASGIAFCGMLVVLRPAGEDFSPAALVPLASALCYALAMIATRGRTLARDPWDLTVALNIVFAAVGAAGMGIAAVIGRAEVYPFLLSAWSTVSIDAIGLLVLLAAISIAIHLLLARAYQLGPTAVVAGLDFSYLGFAALWSLVFFGTMPTAPVWLGTAMICAAGLWSVLRRY